MSHEDNHLMVELIHIQVIRERSQATMRRHASTLLTHQCMERSHWCAVSTPEKEKPYKLNSAKHCLMFKQVPAPQHTPHTHALVHTNTITTISSTSRILPEHHQKNLAK
jgi:hypothetical protein